MNIIDAVEQDHEKVVDLFEQFFSQSAGAVKTRQSLAEEIRRELVVHSHAEEAVVYPAAREMLPDMRDLVLESLEEHHVVSRTLSELEGMKADDERFQAKVSVLKEAVLHHIEEEEDELLPALARKLGDERLVQLGERFESAKEQEKKKLR